MVDVIGRRPADSATRPLAIFALVLAFVSGCITPEAPPVRVRVVVAVGAPELAEYLQGADAWSALGVVASFDASGLPECADVRDAFAGEPCEVVLYVGRGRVAEQYGARGVTSRDAYGRRVSLIDASISGRELVAVAAHEFGHSLLDTGAHVADPRAVMFHASTATTPAADDYALACSSVEACR